MYFNIFLFHFSYIIERGVCYLILCDKSFSKRLAFQYLEDLQTEFSSQYSTRVETVSRPYSFIEFGRCAFFVMYFAIL
jgi:vesicle transport protein SEC22